MNPRYPLYVISKSRWQYKRRLTNRALEQMGVPHYLVVEESQYDEYASVINPEITTVLTLDPAYQEAYNPLDGLGMSKSKGSGPARNFVWDHSLSLGADRHWIVDDNIRAFYRLNRNKRRYVGDGTIFAAMEDFTDRYTNVALSGPNYSMFANERDTVPPFVANTRLYSCILIKNDIPFRWRGRYNEDVILSLDILKSGLCTIQFNAFLQAKVWTQQIKGGNTDEIYSEGTRAKSEMLVRIHPDVARLAWKFQRWHHHVDYRPFKKNRLIRRADIEIQPGVNEYGMKLTPNDSRDQNSEGQSQCTIS